MDDKQEPKKEEKSDKKEPVTQNKNQNDSVNFSDEEWDKYIEDEDENDEVPQSPKKPSINPSSPIVKRSIPKNNSYPQNKDGKIESNKYYKNHKYDVTPYSNYKESDYDYYNSNTSSGYYKKDRGRGFHYSSKHVVSSSTYYSTRDYPKYSNSMSNLKGGLYSNKKNYGNFDNYDEYDHYNFDDYESYDNYEIYKDDDNNRYEIDKDDLYYKENDDFDDKYEYSSSRKRENDYMEVAKSSYYRVKDYKEKPSKTYSHKENPYSINSNYNSYKYKDKKDYNRDNRENKDFSHKPDRGKNITENININLNTNNNKENFQRRKWEDKGSSNKNSNKAFHSTNSDNKLGVITIKYKDNISNESPPTPVFFNSKKDPIVILSDKSKGIEGDITILKIESIIKMEKLNDIEKMKENEKDNIKKLLISDVVSSNEFNSNELNTHELNNDNDSNIQNCSLNINAAKFIPKKKLV